MKKGHERRGRRLVACMACAWLMASSVLLASEAVRLAADTTEIAVAPGGSSTTRFAAEELKTLLSQMLGGDVPIVEKPTEGKSAVVLVNVAMPRDTFTISSDAATRRIVISGHDWNGSIRDHIASGAYQSMRREMATLFGVYELLERYAGARFYFPGEFGTILPKHAWIDVPQTNLVVSPAFLNRNIYFNGDGAWVDGNPCGPYGRCPEKALYHCRLKLETFNIPCCHGQLSLDYQKRFAKTHPEYFCLLPDPATRELRRDTDPSHKLEYHPYQLCHTSGVWDEFYRDVRAYLRGEPASTRGLDCWRSNLSNGYVDVMPMDGMPRCRCANCAKRYHPTDARDFASELIWGNLTDLIARLAADGLSATFTMAAYPPYGRIPEIKLPTNILVTVTKQGPWTERLDYIHQPETESIKAWSRHLNAKVRLWTYPGKYARYVADAVPQMTPRAVGRYFKELHPFLYGAFLESESDRAIYNYLNYYMFARLAWHPEEKPEEILAEHYRLMFGAAAQPMEAFYSALEEKWLGEVCASDNVLPRPGRRIPSVLEMAERVYSPKVLEGYESLFAQAEAAVAKDSPEARRIAFVRRHFLDPLKRRFADYLASLDVGRAMASRPSAAAPGNLIDERAFTFRPANRIRRDREVFLTAPDSIRIDGDGDWTYAAYDFAAQGCPLKTNTRYRVSYYVKYENVVPIDTDGGVAADLNHKSRYGWMNPVVPLQGSHDWMGQSFVINTGKRTVDRPKFYLRVHCARGTAWFDDVRFEEIAPEK